jgi:hypothetical protein
VGDSEGFSPTMKGPKRQGEGMHHGDGDMALGSDKWRGGEERTQLNECDVSNMYE